MDPRLGQIIGRLLDVAVGHPSDRQTLCLDEGRQDQVGVAGRRGDVERVGLGACQSDELGERLDVQAFRDRKRDHDDGDVDDREQVALCVVWHLVLGIRMRRVGRGRNKQQRVVVVGAGESVDGDEAIAAGPILDHHRLAPFRGELVRQQPGGDVDAGGGPERQDEFDRALRVSLRGRRRKGAGRYAKRGDNAN
jgi:hypothetical protein